MRKIRLKESIGVSDERGVRVFGIGAVIEWKADQADRLVEKDLAEYVTEAQK